MVDLPTTALVILDKKPSFVFSSPLSKASCASTVSCFFLKKSNNPMDKKVKGKYTKKALSVNTKTAYLVF